MFKDWEPPVGPKIKLTGAFSEEVEADFAYVPLRLLGKLEYVGVISPDADILCAVTDKLSAGIDALITPDEHMQLLEGIPPVL